MRFALRWRGVRKRQLLSLILLAALATLATAPALALRSETHWPASIQFPPGQRGAIEDLGVKISVEPELGEGSVVGFLVNVNYQDPATENAQNRIVVYDQFVPASCRSAVIGPSLPDATWNNSRDVMFAVEFNVICKAPRPELPAFPALLVKLGCSRADSERRLIDAIRGGQFFDIWATTEETLEPSEAAQAVHLVRTALPVVGAALTAVDVIALSHGELTIGEFAIKYIVGEAVGQLVDHGLEYVEDHAGHTIAWRQTGWMIRCRVCGRTFFRPTLTNGELLVCPSNDHAEAYIYFDN